LVVADGVGYVVDPDDPDAYHCINAWVHDLVVLPERRILVIVDAGIYVTVLDGFGQETRSERISWDGIRHLSVSDSLVSGEAYDPMIDRWGRFTLDLDTHEITGSSF
jgi:hypothetical protein